MQELMQNLWELIQQPLVKVYLGIVLTSVVIGLALRKLLH